MRWTTMLPALAAAMLAAAPARGEGIEAKLREALRTTTAQLRALESENAALKGREAELKARVAQLQAEVDALRKSAAAPAAPVVHHSRAVPGKRLTELTDRVASLEASLATCEEAARASQADARARSEAEAKRLAEESARLRRQLAEAGARTSRVDQVGRELIRWVSSRGLGLAACEPFTQIRRVELENLLQRYDDILATQASKDAAP